MSEVYGDIAFYDSLRDCDFGHCADSVVHILVIAGTMSFTCQSVHYNVASSNYIILPNPSLASGFSVSDNFNAIIMVLSESYVTGLAIRSDYGVVGHMSLLLNPIMPLSPEQFATCLEAMLLLRRRLTERGHLFYHDMVGYLLLMHITDLYDIHARASRASQVSERQANALTRFVRLLSDKEYLRHRSVAHYADALCLTPHYLTEICNKISGKPATYWIDRFTSQEITRLLRRKELPLKEIAFRLNFCSLSHFSRYTQRQLGVSPSQYRQRILSQSRQSPRKDEQN